MAIAVVSLTSVRTKIPEGNPTDEKGVVTELLVVL